jgi:hypothetical protein
MVTMLAEVENTALEGDICGGMAWDLEALTEELWGNLHGEVERQAIHQVLTEVATRYRDARIQTFVPIFVRRDALRILRKRA